MKADWKKFDEKATEPAQGKAVLVTDTAGTVGIGQRVNASGWLAHCCLSNVVAWAPLPEPFAEAKK